MNLSFSKLDTYAKCSMKYKLTHIDKNYYKSDAIFLDVGTDLHKILENKYNDVIKSRLIGKNFIDTTTYLSQLDKLEEDIKTKYGESEYNGYKYKLFKFRERLEQVEDTSVWMPMYCELKFTIEYDGFVFNGIIDRVDMNLNGDFRVVDYKSSARKYTKDEIYIPLQMVVYGIAIKEMFGRYPTDFVYDFILLKEEQKVSNPNFVKFGEISIKRQLDGIRAEKYEAKPSYLCSWCVFSMDSKIPNEELNGMCKKNKSK